MHSTASSVQEYLDLCPLEQKTALLQLRSTIVEHLPKGFEECMNYGMIGYVVPHTIYPAGYHCNPKLPLPFLGLAYQKNAVSLYHMGIYADQTLYNWFTKQYATLDGGKLDMGKSCIRFKVYAKIPFALIGELINKMSVEQRITLYEGHFKK